MQDNPTPPGTGAKPEAPQPEPRKPLAPAAERALAEAAARRAQADTQSQAKAAETGGPAGPEPTRFGDWERKGIISDF